MDANIYIYIYIVAINFVQRDKDGIGSYPLRRCSWPGTEGGRKKSGRKAGMARFPRRAAAILPRPANREAGNAETTLRATEAPPPPAFHARPSINKRAATNPSNARGKASPSSRGEGEKGSKRARAQTSPANNGLLFFFSRAHRDSKYE